MPFALDPAHSSFEFSVRHMVISSTKGRFAKFDATAEIDEANLVNSSATITIDTNSIDTREEARDNHLRSADFFDAANFPTMTYVTKRIEPKGGNDYRIIGDLTVRDMTHEVPLQAEVTGPIKDPYGNTRYGISAEGKINRKDWGLNWNAVMEAGGLLVGDEVKLSAELELVKPA
ncbi:MAG TPA: YceI family protein [Tepidiformaceae bacterium]|jgi:polyisoprenoid-binding protein YceI|nr:YceI family protein [Tepidiformaceae bacterium]